MKRESIVTDTHMAQTQSIESHDRREISAQVRAANAQGCIDKAIRTYTLADVLRHTMHTYATVSTYISVVVVGSVHLAILVSSALLLDGVVPVSPAVESNGMRNVKRVALLAAKHSHEEDADLSMQADPAEQEAPQSKESVLAGTAHDCARTRRTSFSTREQLSSTLAAVRAAVAAFTSRRVGADRIALVLEFCSSIVCGSVPLCLRSLAVIDDCGSQVDG